MPNLYSSASRRFRAPRFTGKILLAASRQFLHECGQWIRSAIYSPAVGSAGPLEQLESRCMMSVSSNASGFTVVTPQSGDHVIYVSSSAGNDANSGLSSVTPVKTLARGVSLMRGGTGDELLLKAGDTWHENLVYWRLSGQSAANPMVLGSYGSGARPTLMSGTSDGFTTGASSAPEIDNVDILGIHFWADGRDPSLTGAPAGSAYATGINILSRTTNFLVENCLVQDYAVNLNFQDFQGPLSNISVRNNVIEDAYTTLGHSQGMYATGVTNLLIEGNLFDHNGYNDSVAGAQATWYNQDCYLSGNNSGCVVRDNIFARAAGYGLQARSGGIVQDNLFLDNPIGASYGLVNGASTHPGGVTGSVTGNVFMGGANIGSIQGGSGLQLANIARTGVTVSNNIFAGSVYNAPAAITLTFGQGQTNPQDSVGINNLTVQNNIIYNWTRGVQVDGGMTPGGSGIAAINNVTFSDNDFENIPDVVINHDDPISSQEHWAGDLFQNTAAPRVAGVTQSPEPNTLLGFASAGRTAASYNAGIGGSSSDAALLAAARTQNEQAWKPAYDAATILNYVKQGFQASGSASNKSANFTGSISGDYFYDANRNGAWDSNEGTSPLWYVYIDANNDGRYDAGDTLTRGDSNGRFTFGGLAAGTYVIRSETADGWLQTVGGARTITVANGQAATGANIGVVWTGSATTTLGSISGTFFYDTNANGVWNQGESTSPLWYVYIDANNDGKYDAGDTQVRAGADGTYTFGNLASGTYRIRAATAAGWKQTTPASGAAEVVTIGSGQNLTNVDFGEVRAS